MNGVDRLESVYHQAVLLWKSFCVEHTALLDATFDEYSLLLSSDVDSLEKKIAEKNKIIEKIGWLEKERQKIVELVVVEKGKKIGSMADLVQILKQYEKDDGDGGHLERFNKLLIDIIEKIQEQNKKNQLFINKAISSLNEMRSGIMGERSYSTYNSRGEQA